MSRGPLFKDFRVVPPFATRIYAGTLICQTETLRQDESRHFYFRRPFFVCSFENEGRARATPASALFVVNGPTRCPARYPRFGRRCFVWTVALDFLALSFLFFFLTVARIYTRSWREKFIQSRGKGREGEIDVYTATRNWKLYLHRRKHRKGLARRAPPFLPWVPLVRYFPEFRGSLDDPTEDSDR